MEWLYKSLVLLQAMLVGRVVLMAFKLEQANSSTRYFAQMVDFIGAPLEKLLEPNKHGISVAPIIIFLILEVLKQLYFTQFF